VHEALHDRYHEGRVSEIRRPSDGGEPVYVGEHMHGEEDGKMISYDGYEPQFERTLAELRVCGNLMASIAVEQSDAP